MKNSLTNKLLIGILIRYCLYISSYQKTISNRIEISTPVNSWNRVQEGVHLLNLNLCPYSGDSLHESPLNLVVYNLFTEMFGKNLYMLFIACDAVTSVLLYYAAQKYLSLNSRNVTNSNSKDYQMLAQYVAVAYMFNPYIIFNCVAFASTVFNNLFLAMFIAGLSSGTILVSVIALALSIHNSFYPVVLLSPLFLHCLMQDKSIRKAIAATTVVCIIWSILTFFSYSVFNNWDSALHSYRYMLEVSNLQPNIGLFWYIFSEMFIQFESLFMFALQINVILLYFVPLSIYLRHDPILLTTTFLTLLAIFKPYPSIGDVGFALTLQLYWKPILTRCPQMFIAGTSLLMCTALAPMLWYLWIYAGSANANFFFGVTLGFGSIQTFLVITLLYAYIKNEFVVRHGGSGMGKMYHLCFE